VTRPPAAIDLGTLPAGPRPERLTPRPARLRRRHRQTAVLAVLAVLVSLTATAAAGPSPWLVAHFTVALGPFGMSADTLYVVETEEFTSFERADGSTVPEPEGPQTLRAYRLRDGALRWEAPLPGRQPQHLFALYGGAPHVVRLPGDDGNGGIATTSLTSFDPHTGQQRWTRNGAVFAVTGGLLIVDPDATTVFGLHDVEVRHLEAVEAATGRTEWRMDVPGGVDVNFTPDGRRLVSQHADGTLTSYDLARGRELATGGEVGSTGAWSVAAGLVVTADHGGTVTAYDVDTLAHRWSATGLPLDAIPVACGTMVCVHTRDGHPAALDPADGRVRWTADWLNADGHHVALRPSLVPGGDDHLVLSVDLLGGPEELYRNPQWLIDAHSGQPVLDMRGWAPGLRPSFWPGADGVELLPYRYDPDADVTWLGWIETDPPAVRVRHHFDGQVICLTRSGYVVCQSATLVDGPSRVQVWRLRD
jgi:outer membrane protein assembly factor BamB